MTMTNDAKTPAPALAVQLQRVFQHIDGRCLLSDIDLNIPSGRVFLLVGPNGASKSLLLHLLAGLHPPSAGTATVLGRDWAGLSGAARVAQRQRIGMVFQNGSLLGDLTVLENILLPLRRDPLTRGEMGRRARLIMTHLHLDGLENLYPDALSGGTLKQIELARALIHQPELLIWDEVLDGLDWDAAQEVLTLIRNERSRRDMTLILTSHQPDLIHQISDQIGVLDRGRLRFSGSIDEAHRAAADHHWLHTLLKGWT
jgi:ABC-type transporter Mla maintaining outer membrane lipid asymmetry ATPase subunit MlaF